MTPVPLQITFQGLPHSVALEDTIRGHVARLAHLHPRLTRCRVVVRRPHRHRRLQARPVQVGILMGRRGAAPVAVRRDAAGPDAEPLPRRYTLEGIVPPAREAYEAVHEAFAVAGRRLRNRTRPRRRR
jgi:hypothetical protein